MLVTAFALLVGYISCRRAEKKAAEYEMERDRAAYEAYLTLCESVSSLCRGAGGEAKAYVRIATDAAARLDLFSDGESEALTEYVRGLAAAPSGAYLLAEILDADREDWREAVSEATELAEERRVGDAVSGRSVDGEWGLLRERTQVSENEAREVAREFIGGGVQLSSAENHSFPLLYSFTCENAAADVTRMGGRLYRLWVFRIGGGKGCGVTECREAAVAFLRRAGIADAELAGETYTAEDASYVFSVEGSDCCRVLITVRRRGGRVTFFDASDYYRYR